MKTLPVLLAILAATCATSIHAQTSGRGLLIAQAFGSEGTLIIRGYGLCQVDAGRVQKVVMSKGDAARTLEPERCIPGGKQGRGVSELMLTVPREFRRGSYHIVVNNSVAPGQPDTSARTEDDLWDEFEVIYGDASLAVLLATAALRELTQTAVVAQRTRRSGADH